MFASALQFHTLVRQCARVFAPTTARTEWCSLLAKRHYSTTDAAAPVPAPNKWPSSKVRTMNTHIESEYVIPCKPIDWESVGRRFGVSPLLCQARYIKTPKKRSLRGENKDSELARMIKTVVKIGFEFPRNGKAIERNWSENELLILRKARGTGKRCKSWANVAKIVGNGRSKADCMDVWSVGCVKALTVATLRKKIVERMAISKAIAFAEHWTPDELDRLKAMLAEKSSCHRAERAEAAIAMFPEKSEIRVRTMLKYLHHDEKKKLLEEEKAEQQKKKKKDDAVIGDTQTKAETALLELPIRNYLKRKVDQ